MSNLIVNEKIKSVTNEMKKFYEQFQFPGKRPLDRDGMIFMRSFNNRVEKIKNNNIHLNVLDAGCGTGNTTISLAKIYKDIRFTGIDNSSASLAKAKISAKNNNLTNVRFRQWNLIKLLPFKKPFDIIYCLGVLHHTADMKIVLRNLYNSLKNDGILYLWIYAKHGRYYHTLNVRLLSMMLNTISDKDDKICFTKEFIKGIKNNIVLKELIKEYKDNTELGEIFLDPVWIADQFLNPNEILIDMEELIKLISICGFNIEKVLGMETNAANYFTSDRIINGYNKLSNYQKLIAFDLLLKPERYFVILSKQ